LKFCLTILHGQGLEAKKALKARYNELVSKKASVKVALAAERTAAASFDDLAAFWEEFVNEEEEPKEETPQVLKKGKVVSHQIISKKPIVTYLDSSIAKVRSVGEDCDPDLDLLLCEPPLKSTKSASTAASSDLQEQQQSKKHHMHKGFKGNNMRWGTEKEEKGKVIINAVPAGVITPAAPAKMC